MASRDIELVRQFNSELSSIYESEPPVSKAKMAAITRFAVKALKYYKHIVHSVEKFVQKCRGEYKIAGLYVLDSIIRQSRHQFGPDKDLFGPRFQRNLKLLFQYIFQCPAEDKPKVVRVLNLWQKNGIYEPDVVSPLIDMASASTKSLQAAIHRRKKAKAAMENVKADFEVDNDNEEFDLSMDQPISLAEVSSSQSRRKRRMKVSQEDEIQVLKAQLEQQRKQQDLLQQQLQMQIMATKQQALQMQLAQQAVKPPDNPLAALLGAAIPQPQPQPNPTANILQQIQELTAQLEQDKATLAAISAQEQEQQQPPLNVPPSQPPQPPQPTQANTQDASQSQFLENFQQLLQTAKGIMQKDPRQQPQPQPPPPQPQQLAEPPPQEGLLEQFSIEKDQQPVPQDIKPPLSHEPNQNEARNEEIRQDERPPDFRRDGLPPDDPRWGHNRKPSEPNSHQPPPEFNSRPPPSDFSSHPPPSDFNSHPPPPEFNSHPPPPKKPLLETFEESLGFQQSNLQQNQPPQPLTSKPNEPHQSHPPHEPLPPHQAIPHHQAVPPQTNQQQDMLNTGEDMQIDNDDELYEPTIPTVDTFMEKPPSPRSDRRRNNEERRWDTDNRREDESRRRDGDDRRREGDRRRDLDDRRRESEDYSRRHDDYRRRDHEGDRRRDLEGDRRRDPEGDRRRDEDSRRRDEDSRRRDYSDSRRREHEGDRRRDADDSRRRDNEDTRRRDQDDSRRRENEDSRKREQEKREKDEKEHERRQKEKAALPPPMRNRMTVASVTLWVGRLPKGSYDMLTQSFGEFGEIKNIDLIDMRGCAFVTMANRIDADKAYRRLRNRKLFGYDIKMAWGQAKCLQEFSNFWNDDSGCAFIPWGAFREEHLPTLMDGCVIDEDTLPPDMKLPSTEQEPEPEAEADQPETPTEPAKSEPQLPPPFIGNPLGGPPLPPMLPPGMRGPFPPMPPPGMLRLDGLPPLPPLGGNLLPFPGPFGPPLPGLPIQNDPRLRPEMVRGIPPSNDQFRPPNNKITPPLQLERPSFQPRNGPNDSLETQQPPRPPFRHRFPPPNIRGPFFPPRNQDMHQNRFPPPMDPNRDRGNITGESQAEENRFVRRDSAEEHRKPGFPGGNNAPGNVPPTEMLPSDGSASNLKRKKNKPKKPIFGGVFGGIFPFGNEDGREEENNSETPPWLKNSEKDKAPNHPVEGQPGNVRPMRPPRMDGQQRNPPPIPPIMPGQPRIPPPMQLRMLGQPRNPPPRAPPMEGQPRNGPAFSGLPPGIFVTEQPRFGMGERESLLPPGKPHISKDEEGVNFRRELDNMDKSKDIQKGKEERDRERESHEKSNDRSEGSRDRERRDYRDKRDRNERDSRRDDRRDERRDERSDRRDRRSDYSDRRDRDRDSRRGRDGRDRENEMEKAYGRDRPSRDEGRDNRNKKSENKNQLSEKVEGKPEKQDQDKEKHETEKDIAAGVKDMKNESDKKTHQKDVTQSENVDSKTSGDTVKDFSAETVNATSSEISKESKQDKIKSTDPGHQNTVHPDSKINMESQTTIPEKKDLTNKEASDTGVSQEKHENLSDDIPANTSDKSEKIINETKEEKPLSLHQVENSTPFKESAELEKISQKPDENKESKSEIRNKESAIFPEMEMREAESTSQMEVTGTVAVPIEDKPKVEPSSSFTGAVKETHEPILSCDPKESEGEAQLVQFVAKPTVAKEESTNVLSEFAPVVQSTVDSNMETSQTVKVLLESAQVSQTVVDSLSVPPAIVDSNMETNEVTKVFSESTPTAQTVVDSHSETDHVKSNDMESSKIPVEQTQELDSSAVEKNVKVNLEPVMESKNVDVKIDSDEMTGTKNEEKVNAEGTE